ncbi:FAD-dependent oxidoreductase [Oryzibacter oryziterrae]|uniref:FAD-dependent oxidoreductase n=1 Tax=Oryzibacter oryziterrae TaxID=2766474 RepID=UPI001F40D8DF|nr:FAD-dependent oxidoreductase [Oryzibacter oryziterrae]
MVDLAVVGAGPMGLVTALMAARAGLKVAIYERADDFSASAGWKAGGMLAPECEGETSDGTVVELGRRSIELWPTLVEGVKVDGTLVIAGRRDPGMLDKFADQTEGFERVDSDQLAELEPALSGHYARGLYYKNEGHLDPRVTFTRLKKALDHLKVKFHFGWVGVLDSLPAGRVVDSRGMGARDRFKELRGVKGEMALIRSHDVSLNRPVRLLHHRHPLYVVPRANGVFMIGATTVESDRGDVVTLRSAGELLTQAYALHPGFAEAEVLEFNAGLRPALPDNNPVISVGERIVAVNGLYRHGWLLAPGIAEDLVRVIYMQATKVIHARPSQR